MMSTPNKLFKIDALEDEVTTVRVRRHSLQNLAKIGKLLRPTLFAGMPQIFDERLHAVEAGFVQWLQNVSAANRNAPEPQVGSSIVTCVDDMPERPQQLRALAVLDHVLRELADIEIEGD